MITKKKILSAVLALSMLPGLGALPAGAQDGYTSTPDAVDQLMDGAFMDTAADLDAWSVSNAVFMENADGAQGVMQVTPASGSYISVVQTIPMKYGSWYKIRARVKMINPAAECADAGFLPVGFADNSSNYLANKGGNDGQMRVTGQEWVELYSYYRYIGLNGAYTFGQEQDVNFMLRFGQNNPAAVASGVYVDYFTVEEIQNGEDLILGGKFDDPALLQSSTSEFTPEPWFIKSDGYECEPFQGVRYNKNAGWEYTWNPAGTDPENDSAYISVKAPSGSYPTLTQNIRLEKGQKYLFSVRVRPAAVEGKTTTNAQFFLMSAEYNNEQKFSQPQELDSKTINLGEWTNVYQEYTYDGEYDFVDAPLALRVGQYDPSNVANGVDFDDFTVIPIDDDGSFAAGAELNNAYDLSMWSIGGATASMTSVDGSPAAKLVPNGTGNFMQMSQTTKDFVADQWYKVSARAKLLPNSDGSKAGTTTAGLMLVSDNFTHTYITSDGGQGHGDTVVTSDEWADIYGYFRYTGVKWNETGTPLKNTQVMLRIGTNEMDQVANGAYVDYIRVEPVESDNILVGSGFDDETLVNGTSAKEKIYDGWRRKETGYELEIWNGLKSKYLSGNAQWRNEDGNGYIHMTNRTGDGFISLPQMVSLEAGKTYVAKARVRPAMVEEFADTPPSADFMLTKEENVMADYEDVEWKPVPLVYDQWTTVERTFTIPADIPVNDYGNIAAVLELRVAQGATDKVANGVDIDDVTLEEVGFSIGRPALNITDLSDLSDVRASFTATSTYSAKDVTVFAASYDVNGKLLQADAEKITVTAGKDQTYTTKALAIPETAAKVKVMVWDAASQKPYTEYAQVEDNSKSFF